MRFPLGRLGVGRGSGFGFVNQFVKFKADVGGSSQRPRKFEQSIFF